MKTMGKNGAQSDAQRFAAYPINNAAKNGKPVNVVINTTMKQELP
jgi:hypothetical protein